MKKIKKLFVSILTVVICITCVSFTSSAADTFEPIVRLNRR